MADIGVLIVDDHPLYRQGISAALADRPGIRTVGAVGTAAEALAVCARERPDVMLLDVNLPDRSGIEVAHAARLACASTRVIALTAYDDEAYILALAEAGVRGYLLKTATDAEILAAVRAVAAGGSVFAPAVTEALLRHAREDTSARDHGLTQRELEVLRLVATGLTNRDIGHRMGISGRTVQAHLSHIYGKLGVVSRTEAVTVSIRDGLLQVAPGDGAARPAQGAPDRTLRGRVTDRRP
jgi:DNA-binding NarL/FixJ family response regulator